MAAGPRRDRPYAFASEMGDAASIFVPEQASSVAPSFDAACRELLGLGVACLALVLASSAVLLWRARPRARVAEPLGWRGTLGLLLAAAPVVPLAHVWWDGVTRSRTTLPPADAIPIHVEAFQWGWRFTQPNGFVESQLWIPRGEPVRLVMESIPRGTTGEGAVLHSLNIPAFRVRREILPGRPSSLWLTATREGSYDIYCAAFCGAPPEGPWARASDLRIDGRPPIAAGHAGMLSRVHVVAPEVYREHLDASSCGGLHSDDWVEWGRELFEQNACEACHVRDPAVPASVGPNLARMAGTLRPVGGAHVLADVDYLRESIARPEAAIVDGYASSMPSFASLGELKIDALVAYVASLSEHGRPLVEAVKAAHVDP